ncbi:MAG: hypothetical protein V1800_06735 [Candidatus Latescibacterota bacterium]
MMSEYADYNRPSIAILQIQTWRRVCGIHYYGRIRVGGVEDEITVERKLSRQDAVRINREDDLAGHLYAGRYAPGDLCSRFFEREDMVHAAIEQAKKSSASTLVITTFACCDPAHIAWSSVISDDTIQELNRLQIVCDEIGWGASFETEHNEQMQRAVDAWMDLWRSTGAEEPDDEPA